MVWVKPFRNHTMWENKGGIQYAAKRWFLGTSQNHSCYRYHWHKLIIIGLYGSKVRGKTYKEQSGLWWNLGKDRPYGPLPRHQHNWTAEDLPVRSISGYLVQKLGSICQVLSQCWNKLNSRTFQFVLDCSLDWSASTHRFVLFKNKYSACVQ